jgi:type IV pilus assembly protein PilA
MFMKLQKRMKGEKGFTLIELLVVIIIIAILAAIAIPTFLGQRQKAQDAAAKSLVRNAMTAIESAYVDLKTFAVATMTDTVLEGIEPSIDFIAVADAATAEDGTGAAADSDQVAYWGNDTTYAAGSTSESEKTFGVYVNKGAGGGSTFYINGAAASW